MFKEDALNFFGTNTKVAIAAGVDRSAVSQWKDLVPEGRAQRLADASNGALHYDKNVFPVLTFFAQRIASMLIPYL